MVSLSKGRVNQKLRTRNALVETAARMIRDRKTFTVADVADAAKVGRTTAYRYFPTLDELVGHATLWALTETEDAQIAQARENGGSLHERLMSIVAFSDASIAQHEAEYRTMLRMSLEQKTGEADSLPRRSGLRANHLAEALASLEDELGAPRFRTLCAGLSLFIGIESSVVLRDVCLLGEDEAREVKFWGAGAMLDAALAEAREDPPKTKPARKPVAPRAGDNGAAATQTAASAGSAGA